MRGCQPHSQTPDRIAVYDWREHILKAQRLGVLATQRQRDYWSTRGRNAGIADPAAEITTVLRILGPGPEDEEHEERAGYVSNAPQAPEKAPSATPAPGAAHEEHEEPGPARDALQHPNPLEESTPAATEPGDHPNDTPPPTVPATHEQQPTAGAGSSVHDGDEHQPPPAKPATPPDMTAPLRRAYEQIVGKPVKWTHS